MRYIVIIAFFIFSCTATNQPMQAGKPGSFIILIQYNEQQSPIDVLNILQRMTIMEHYDMRVKNIYSSEIEATCFNLKETRIDFLVEQLKQTAGVVNVVVNPRY